MSYNRKAFTATGHPLGHHCATKQRWINALSQRFPKSKQQRQNPSQFTDYYEVTSVSVPNKQQLQFYTTMQANLR